MPISSKGGGTTGGDTASVRSRRRRPASPAVTAARKAWGKKWGAVMSEHAQTYKRKG